MPASDCADRRMPSNCTDPGSVKRGLALSSAIPSGVRVKLNGPSASFDMLRSEMPMAGWAMTCSKLGRGALSLISTTSGIGDKIPSALVRTEEHTSELQTLKRISYDVFCLNKNIHIIKPT